MKEEIFPKNQSLMIKDKKMNGGVSTTNLVMRKLFTVQKEKHLHIFSVNCSTIFELQLTPTTNLFFMIDQCDESLVLEKIIFEEKNYEIKL